MSFPRRVWRGLQWLFPAFLLVFMPKCPVCVAAYVALSTGVGISVSTARGIQILLLVFCLSSLAYPAGKYCLSNLFQRNIKAIINPDHDRS